MSIIYKSSLLNFFFPLLLLPELISWPNTCFSAQPAGTLPSSYTSMLQPGDFKGNAERQKSTFLGHRPLGSSGRAGPEAPVSTISDPLSEDLLQKRIFLIYPSRMDMDRDKMAERILHLTLEILFHLTGEDYTVVKKTSSDRCQDPVSEGWGRPLSPITGPPPHPLIHENINDQKILELTYKMIELLTGEVPIRCQDVAVYFSMEEWEYLEGHRDLYKNVIMEVPQPLTSPGNRHD
ncbi:uncharacterized protein [Dendrobates tinctorius]|uniref:uncharacterized protein n=1 Tax=Dendrobates tinctorius TaxID=92724 RepID=UPI003CC9BAF8